MATVKKIKKAQFGLGRITKGGSRSGGGSCAAYTSSADRADRREARQADRDYNKLMRQNKRDERKEARAEKKAAKAAPAAKHGKSVMKKAQNGLTEMGKKTTKAAIDKRTSDMAKALDKASVLGKNYIAPGDSAKKKAVKKPVPKKKMGGPVKACWGTSKMKKK